MAIEKTKEKIKVLNKLPKEKDRETKLKDKKNDKEKTMARPKKNDFEENTSLYLGAFRYGWTSWGKNFFLVIVPIRSRLLSSSDYFLFPWSNFFQS